MVMAISKGKKGGERGYRVCGVGVIGQTQAGDCLPRFGGSPQPGGKEPLPGVGVPIGVGLNRELMGVMGRLLGLGGPGLLAWGRKLGLGTGLGQGPGLGLGRRVPFPAGEPGGCGASFPFGLGPSYGNPLAPGSAGGWVPQGRNRAKTPPHGPKNRLESGVDRRSSFCYPP